MAMSDCVKCWDTPCTCGWEYRKYTKEARLSLAANVLGIPREELRKMIWDAIPVAHPKDETPNLF